MTTVLKAPRRHGRRWLLVWALKELLFLDKEKRKPFERASGAEEGLLADHPALRHGGACGIRELAGEQGPLRKPVNARSQANIQRGPWGNIIVDRVDVYGQWKSLGGEGGIQDWFKGINGVGAGFSAATFLLAGPPLIVVALPREGMCSVRVTFLAARESLDWSTIQSLWLPSGKG